MEQQLFMSEKAEANSQLQIEKFFKDGVWVFDGYP